MGGVPEQGRATEGPAGYGVAIDHREQVGARRRSDDGGHVQPSEVPAVELGQEVLELAGPVPILGPSEGRLRATQLGDEIELLASAGEVGDGIGHELLVAVAGPDHRPAVQHRVGLGRASPQEGAVPARPALGGIALGPGDAVDAVRRHEPVPDSSRPPPSSCGTGVGAFPVGLHPLEPVPEVEVIRSHPFDESVEQHVLEGPAVDGELWPGVACRAAPLLAPDLLTVGRAVHESRRLDRVARSVSSNPSACSSRTA